MVTMKLGLLGAIYALMPCFVLHVSSAQDTECTASSEAEFDYQVGL